VAVSPAATTTYTLTAQNASGSASAQTTVTVQSAAATAAASFLQAAAASSDARLSSLSAGPLTTAAGDLLVAAVAWDTSSSSTMSLSDSKGNAWTAATTRQVDTRNAQALQVFYAPNIAGGADTVTVVPSPPAPWVRVIVHEVTGAAPSAPLDQTAVNNTGSGTSISAGPVTTAAAGEYIFTAAMNDGAAGSATFSAGSGYVLRAVAAPGDNELASADQVQSVAGSIPATWSLSQSSESMAQMTTFRASTAAPAVVAAQPGVDSGLSGNLAIRNLGNGWVAISGRSAPGGIYIIEYRADSAPAGNWLTLGAVTADASGAFVLVENLGPGRRFYRAVNP
jgi:hypothetical protein